MHKNTIAVVVIGFVLSSGISAQDVKDFPAITIADIPGGTINQENVFDGNSLWGHIDGGADVYLEYGFDKLLFQDISWEGNSFRVEVYKMTDAETAFGIYSISTHKCDKQDTLTKWICITPFQVQAAVGKFYVSIANEKGTKDTEKQTVELLEKILLKQTEKLFELPETFTTKIDPKNYNSVKFIRGDLGLQNCFPSWQDMFSGFKNYNTYILQLDNDQQYTYLSKVSFNTSEEASRFLNSIGIKIDPSRKHFALKTGKELREVKIISDKEFYYCESNQAKPVLEKF
jgi:hypothetical protein